MSTKFGGSRCLHRLCSRRLAGQRRATDTEDETSRTIAAKQCPRMRHEISSVCMRWQVVQPVRPVRRTEVVAAPRTCLDDCGNARIAPAHPATRVTPARSGDPQARPQLRPCGGDPGLPAAGGRPRLLIVCSKLAARRCAHRQLVALPCAERPRLRDDLGGGAKFGAAGPDAQT